MAITWRNIEAPSFSDALKAGTLAQQSFNAGFDNLNKILQERQALQEQNWQTNQDNLKQGFLDALYGVKTPEELAALQQSGQLNQMLQGMAPQTREALRGQDEQRRADLMNQLTQQQQFTDAQQERTARPIVDRLSMMANSEDVDLRNSAKAALGIYQGHGMVPNAGKLSAEFTGANRSALEFGEKEKGWAHDAEMRPLKLAGVRTSNALASEQLAGQRLNNRRDEQAFNDETVIRGLQARVAQAQQDHIESTRQQGLQLGQIARSIGLGDLVDSNGLPRVNDMTEEQLLTLQHQAVLHGMPEPNAYMRQDTQAADAFLASLEGEVRPDILAKFREDIRSGFDSTRTASLVGGDKALADRAAAQTQVYMEEIGRNNWNTPNSPDALRNHNELLEAIPKLVNEDSRESVVRMIYEASTKGVKAKDGNYYVPSMNEILNAIQSTTDEFWKAEGWNLIPGLGLNDPVNMSHGEKALRILQSRMQEADATKRLADAEQYKAWKRKRDVQGILQPK